jgi:primosomal protein N' (replication factor Y) (superfamily II helicase)
LDLPKVTFVGVISADTSLNIPDFRSGERTFDLLTQVAGRAGRGHAKGHVLIQTYCPNHYAIKAASRHDYDAFYEEEIKMRKSLGLPPFYRLVELRMQGKNEEALRKSIESLAENLGKKGEDPSSKGMNLKMLGPSPDRVPKVRGNFCYRLIIKSKKIEPLALCLKNILRDGHRFQGLVVSVDVDPL